MISRIFQIVLGLFFIPVIVLCAMMVVEDLSLGDEPSDRMFLYIPISAAIGIYLAGLSWRLLTNRPRAEGGLFSPLVLRLGAIFLASVPVLAVALHTWRYDGPLSAIHLAITISHFGAAFGLLRLANRRAQIRQELREVEAESARWSQVNPPSRRAKSPQRRRWPDA